MAIHYTDIIQAKSLPDLIISDLDNSLTDTSIMMAHLAAFGDKAGIPISQVANWVLETGNKVYKTVFGKEFDDATHFKKFVLDHLRTESEDSIFFLSAAFDKGIPVILVSNCPKSAGYRTVHQLQMSHFFQKDYYREDLPFPKPDPESFHYVLQDGAPSLRKNSNIWVYGDMDIEVKWAHSASALSEHNIIPVALEGTSAADTIRKMSFEFNNKGLIFNDLYSMACYLRPEMETCLKKVAGFTNAPLLDVASYRPA